MMRFGRALQLLLACVVVGQALQDRPVIGILSVPTSSVGNANLTQYGASFIPASYIKWIESAGARVLPIQFDSTAADLHAYFNAINGLVLIGGNADIFEGPFAAVTNVLLNMAANASRNGDSLPVWGTCQGFEQLAVYFSGGEHILSKVDAEQLFLPLEFTKGAEKSALLQAMSPAMLKSLRTNNLTANLHSESLLLETVTTSATLTLAVNVLATNVDREGKRFVSLMQGRELPFYAAQFHPEKNGYEFDQAWDSKATEIHKDAGIEMAQYFASAFVRRSRENKHIASDASWLQAKLIYNFAPLYTSKVLPGRNLWEQAYIFPPSQLTGLQMV